MNQIFTLTTVNIVGHNIELISIVNKFGIIFCGCTLLNIIGMCCKFHVFALDENSVCPIFNLQEGGGYIIRA